MAAIEIAVGCVFDWHIESVAETDWPRLKASPVDVLVSIATASLGSDTQTRSNVCERRFGILEATYSLGKGRRSLPIFLPFYFLKSLLHMTFKFLVTR